MDYFVLLVIISVIVLLVYIFNRPNNPQDGGFIPLLVNSSTGKFSPQIQRQICEIKNVNHFLGRDVTPGDDEIRHLHPFSPMEPQFPLQPLLEKPLVNCPIAQEKLETDTKTLVEVNQPFFLESPFIIQFYGKHHYFDARYPRKPIHVSFLENPEKFVKENPMVYPSYVIRSRDFSQLKSN